MTNKYSFSKDGVTIIDLLDQSDLNYITFKVCKRIQNGFNSDKNLNIFDYHKWCKEYESKRDFVLSPAQRHFSSKYWKEIHLESRIEQVLKSIHKEELTIWDEGFGTSAFRLVRPFYNDGYPASKKSWGPGGKLISVTIPLYGFTENESQGFILGSHKKEYDSYIDPNQKFCKEERRLKDYNSYKFTRFNIDPGQCIIFHWNTIHTEQIIGNKTTRLALEIRYGSK